MIAALGLVLLLAQAAPAPPIAPLQQNQAPVTQHPAPSQLSQVPGIDRTFALAAIQGNNAEIDIARLALGRATIPDVRAFAEKMIGEHMGLADEMLPDLQRVLGSMPPARLAPPDALAFAHLQTVSDVDFDQVYALTQVGDHLATMTAFQTEIDNGTDPHLKALARKWMPTIQAHLQLAVSLAQHVGGSSPFKSH